EFNGTGGIAIFGNPVSASGQPNIGNAIEGNSIFENGRSNPSALLGIDLTNGFPFPKDDGITPNDPMDVDAGANVPNNFQNFLVFSNVTTDAGGNVNFNVTVPGSATIGQLVTATATDPPGNTSEFSAAQSVGQIGGLPECDIATLNDLGDPGTAVLQDDADNPGTSVLLVTGTSRGDVIVI